jgi:hypothetical protein
MKIDSQYISDLIFNEAIAPNLSYNVSAQAAATYA